MKYLVRVTINTLGLWLYVLFISGISLHGLDSNRDIALYLLVGGAVLGVVDRLAHPILVILSIPLYILTSGLFFLIINAIMLRLTTALTTGFDIGAAATVWVAAVMGGILLSLFNALTDAAFPKEYRRC